MESSPIQFLRRRKSAAAFVALCLLIAGGCQTAGKRTFTVERPVKHVAAGDGFVIQTDFPLTSSSPLVRELNDLRTEITRVLKLPEQRDPVTVYLFSDEASYRRYMQTTWPNLPPRRAYFVGTSRELAVYSFRSSKVQEDLRHEFTHGLLHGCLNNVPLWLDEGLAEYFEVRAPMTGGPHRSHIAQLQDARAEGWNPSLYQLEQLADFQRMTQQDYAEAWGWVHYMLEDDPAARQVLVEYIAELKEKTIAPPFMPRLEESRTCILQRDDRTYLQHGTGNRARKPSGMTGCEILREMQALPPNQKGPRLLNRSASSQDSQTCGRSAGIPCRYRSHRTEAVGEVLLRRTDTAS